jgi:hypothetical protein
VDWLGGEAINWVKYIDSGAPVTPQQYTYDSPMQFGVFGDYYYQIHVTYEWVAFSSVNFVNTLEDENKTANVTAHMNRSITQSEANSISTNFQKIGGSLSHEIAITNSAGLDVSIDLTIPPMEKLEHMLYQLVGTYTIYEIYFPFGSNTITRKLKHSGSIPFKVYFEREIRYRMENENQWVGI